MSRIHGRINLQSPINWNHTLNQNLIEVFESLPGGAGIYKGGEWKGLLRRYNLPPSGNPLISGNRCNAKDSTYGSYVFDSATTYFELPFDAIFNQDSYTIHAVYNVDSDSEGDRVLVSTRYVNTSPTNIKGYVFWGRVLAEARSEFWQGDGTNAAWDTIGGYPVPRLDNIFSTVTYNSPTMTLIQNTSSFTNTEGQFVKAISPAVLRVGAGKSAVDGNSGGNATAALFFKGRLSSLRFYNGSFTRDKAAALNTEAMNGYPNLYNWD